MVLFTGALRLFFCIYSIISRVGNFHQPRAKYWSVPALAADVAAHSVLTLFCIHSWECMAFWTCCHINLPWSWSRLHFQSYCSAVCKTCNFEQWARLSLDYSLCRWWNYSIRNFERPCSSIRMPVSTDLVIRLQKLKQSLWKFVHSVSLGGRHAFLSSTGSFLILLPYGAKIGQQFSLFSQI